MPRAYHAISQPTLVLIAHTVFRAWTNRGRHTDASKCLTHLAAISGVYQINSVVVLLTAFS